MIVRTIDAENDWTFGKGRNNYKRSQEAVAQTIKTRLQCFLGDCFFAANEGIDWWNLLGSKNQTALLLAISSTILNTRDVTKMEMLSVNLSDARRFTVSYKVLTIYEGANKPIQETTGYLITEDGDVLVTESGDQINA